MDVHKITISTTIKGRCRQADNMKEEEDRMDRIMPILWRMNNWIDRKLIHIRAWLAAVTDEPDRPYEDDVIERLWRARCGK